MVSPLLVREFKRKRRCDRSRVISISCSSTRETASGPRTHRVNPLRQMHFSWQRRPADKHGGGSGRRVVPMRGFEHRGVLRSLDYPPLTDECQRPTGLIGILRVPPVLPNEKYFINARVIDARSRRFRGFIRHWLILVLATLRVEFSRLSAGFSPSSRFLFLHVCCISVHLFRLFSSRRESLYVYLDMFRMVRYFLRGKKYQISRTILSNLLILECYSGAAFHPRFRTISLYKKFLRLLHTTKLHNTKLLLLRSSIRLSSRQSLTGGTGFNGRLDLHRRRYPQHNFSGNAAITCIWLRSSQSRV